MSLNEELKIRTSYDFHETELDVGFARCVLETVSTCGYAVVKNVFALPHRKESLASLVSLYSGDDNVDLGLPVTATLSPSTFRWKTNVGDVDADHNRFPRCFETYYIPRNDARFSHFDVLFERMLDLRNCLLGRPPNYVRYVDQIEGLWSACRLQHYFKGGGFFSGHTDIIIKNISTESLNHTVQLVGVLSKRGEDFSSGGSYLVKNGARVDLEDIVDVGDVIVYDGGSFHGVEEIDKDSNLTLCGSYGRWSALVSIYKLLGD